MHDCVNELQRIPPNMQEKIDSVNYLHVQEHEALAQPSRLKIHSFDGPAPRMVARSARTLGNGIAARVYA